MRATLVPPELTNLILQSARVAGQPPIQPAAPFAQIFYVRPQRHPNEDLDFVMSFFGILLALLLTFLSYNIVYLWLLCILLHIIFLMVCILSSITYKNGC